MFLKRYHKSFAFDLGLIYILQFLLFYYIRITPSSPSLTRVLDQDVVLSGYHVPAKVSKKSQGWSLNPKTCLLEALLCIRQRLHQSCLLESINLAALVMARILGANHKRLLLNENSGYADKISLVALLENSLPFLPAPLRNIRENDIITFSNHAFTILHSFTKTKHIHCVQCRTM